MTSDVYRRWPYKPETAWGKLVQDLAWALDLRGPDLGRVFGLQAAGIARVLKGGRPSLKLVLRLRKLEQAYARELAALRKGKITVAPSGKPGVIMRVDWRKGADVEAARLA